ncbi:MAG TPA: hypothetical protein DDY68_03740 [Porphyromonadaceae bacterium]|nr:hypothetical protein [Porphyromonadaceae bacterium]
MITSNQLRNWIKTPESLDRTALRDIDDLLHEFPSSYVLYFLYLRTLKNIHSFKLIAELKSPSFQQFPYKKKMYGYLFENKPFMRVQKEETRKSRTMIVIERFLSLERYKKQRVELSLEDLTKSSMSSIDYVSRYL